MPKIDSDRPLINNQFFAIFQKFSLTGFSIFNVLQFSVQSGLQFIRPRVKWHSQCGECTQKERKVLFRPTKESGSSRRDFSQLRIASFSQTISTTKEKKSPDKKAGSFSQTISTTKEKKLSR